MNMLIENLGLAYAQLVDTMENHMAPPDGANMPEARSDWQRPLADQVAYLASIPMGAAVVARFNHSVNHPVNLSLNH